MTVKDRVTEAIFRAINEVNQQLPRDKQLVKSISAPLSGRSGQLDSLGVTLLLVASEEYLEEKFTTPISLISDKMLSDPPGPLNTVGTFIDHVCMILEVKTNASKQP